MNTISSTEQRKYNRSWTEKKEKAQEFCFGFFFWYIC